jgi:hypothetical protein
MWALTYRTFCRENLRSLYILEMMTFAIKNPDNYQPNVAIRGKDMRQRNQLHLQISKTIFRPKGCLLFLNKDI